MIDLKNSWVENKTSDHTLPRLGSNDFALRLSDVADLCLVPKLIFDKVPFGFGSGSEYENPEFSTLKILGTSLLVFSWGNPCNADWNPCVSSIISRGYENCPSNEKRMN